VNANFGPLSHNGGTCVLPPTGHTNCNRGSRISVTSPTPYNCNKTLTGTSTFVTIKKGTGTTCTIH